MGPFETARLNANGFVDYCERYGQGIYNVSQTMQEIPLMTAESSVSIDQQLQDQVPEDKIAERRLWRDENLALLATFKAQNGV